MIISMLLSPFIIAASDRIVMRFSAAEWMLRSLELHRIAVQSIESDRHVVILGYGRNGQRLARLLDAEGVRYIALDLDPERVREAALAGDTVVFADCSRREALTAAGLARAAAVVITFADADASIRVLANIHALNPAIPVIVRAREEGEIDRLHAAGASEVVPEALESGLMLASHTLVWIGVPLSRVMRRLRLVRDQHYGLMRGLFHGAGDEGEGGDLAQPRLHSVTLDLSAHGVGKLLSDLGLDRGGVEVKAIRRIGVGKLAPAPDLKLEANDVVVLLGNPESLAAAEIRLLQG
jgi:CPA2 family monovalent cation:H+ antiporter-2